MRDYYSLFLSFYSLILSKTVEKVKAKFSVSVEGFKAFLKKLNVSNKNLFDYGQVRIYRHF